MVTTNTTLPEYFTLDHLIAWLENKPSDEKYRFYDNRNCLFAQFVKGNVKEGEEVSVGPSYFHVKTAGGMESDWQAYRLPDGFEYIANSEGAFADTFGEALTRAFQIKNTPRSEWSSEMAYSYDHEEE